MRSRIFTAISIVLLSCCPKAAACGPWYYEPEEYYMFRISDSYLTGGFASTAFNYGSDENCRLWQEQTSGKIPVSDIYDVVYKANSSWIGNLLYHKKNIYSISVGSDRNRFSEWLWNDEEAAEFLLLAKQCEETREKMVSPWYYPARKDPERMSLEDIVVRADEYKGKRFADRYLLQVERALFSLHDYDGCINRWNEMSASLPDNIIRRLIVRYVGGAYYNIGDVNNAMRLFGEAGDIESLLYCAREKKADDLAVLYDYAPESPVLRKNVELSIISAERWYYDNGGETYSVWGKTMTDNLNSTHDLCLRIAEEGRVSDPDLWYYCAAFIEHLLGRNADASLTLAKAESSKGSRYIKESIKVLRIYLDSLGPYDSAYEKKMLDGVKWLEGKVIEHLDEARETTISVGMYYTGTNMSYFYWNDMLRKVVHSGIVPRLMDSHREVSAIAFSNMADNLIFNMVGEVNASWSSSQRMSLERYREEGAFNSLDYSNMTFDLLESADVESVIRYVHNLDRPETETIRYLNRRGYTDKDFFCDYIGTRMIRDMRYPEAEAWLARVSPSFQKQLNTFREGYLSFDPFSPERTRRKERADVKYNFAREMASLEKAIGETRDPDRKAVLMTRFATGMKNSLGDCWALSFYRLNSWDYDKENLSSPFLSAQGKAFDRAEKLYATALSICLDRETAAQVNLFLGNGKTVVRKYRTTQAADYVRGHCDTYVDYHLENRKKFWRH